MSVQYDVLIHKLVLTHMSAHMDLTKMTSPYDASIPFIQIVGAILWLARHTRPEIMQSVLYLTQFCTCYDRDIFSAALHTLKYVCTIKCNTLTFRGGRDSPLPADQARLTVDSDSDWALGSTDR